MPGDGPEVPPLVAGGVYEEIVDGKPSGSYSVCIAAQGGPTGMGRMLSFRTGWVTPARNSGPMTRWRLACNVMDFEDRIAALEGGKNLDEVRKLRDEIDSLTKVVNSLAGKIASMQKG